MKRGERPRVLPHTGLRLSSPLPLASPTHSPPLRFPNQTATGDGDKSLLRDTARPRGTRFWGQKREKKGSGAAPRLEWGCSRGLGGVEDIAPSEPGIASHPSSGCCCYYSY